MKTKLYNFNIELSWKLLNKLSQIDIDLDFWYIDLIFDL